MAESSKYLHRPAQFMRKFLISTGGDRYVAAWTNNHTDGLIARCLRPDNVLYPNPSTRRVTRNGLLYDLDLHDYIEWTIYFGVEKDVKSSLYGLVGKGQTAIDVGTNVGEVLLNFARIVGPSGIAIGFEPNPTTRAKCQHNLALNSLANVKIHGVALGNEAGEVLLGRPNASNAGADRVMSSGHGLQTVPVTTLDQFLEEHPVAKLDLIKIDVEGFDLNVLHGASRTIDKFRPKLFVELSDSNLREQADCATELISWLEKRDYRVINAISGEDVRSTDPLDGCFFDIIATPSP